MTRLLPGLSSGPSGMLLAETEFLCLCFSVIILAGGLFPPGGGGRGSATAVSPPARSASSTRLCRLCLPACRNDFLIMQPVLGIANPPPARHPLLRLAPPPSPSLVSPEEWCPVPHPSLCPGPPPSHGGREGRPGLAMDTSPPPASDRTWWRGGPVALLARPHPRLGRDLCPPGQLCLEGGRRVIGDPHGHTHTSVIFVSASPTLPLCFS